MNRLGLLVTDDTHRTWNREETPESAPQDKDRTERLRQDFVRALDEEIKPAVHQILAMLGLLTHSGLNENQIQFTASIQQAADALMGKLEKLERAQRIAIRSASAGSGSRKLRGQVLLVDSNAANHESFSRLLQAAGCDVHNAPNGTSALQSLSRYGFDAIVVNTHLTGSSGEEFIREVRNRKVLSRAAAHIPIVAYSDPELWGDEDKIRAVGADGFLAKPYGTDTVLDALQPLLRQPIAPGANHVPTAPDREEEPAEDLLIDTKVIATLRQRRTGKDTNAFLRAFKKLLEDSPRMVGDIFQGFKAGRSDQVEAAALKLKTSSAAIGAVRLARHCHRLQVACRMGVMADAQDVVKDLERVFRESCEALHKEVERDLRRRTF